MNSFLITVHFVVAILVIAQFVVILALARYLGRTVKALGLNEPGGSGANQLNVGDRLEPMELFDLGGSALTVPMAGANTLLLFLSPSCVVCRRITSSFSGVLSQLQSPNLQVVLVTPSPADENGRSYLVNLARLGLPVVASNDVVNRMAIQVYPYAFVLNEEGMVRAKGVIDEIDQLVSLVRPEVKASAI